VEQHTNTPRVSSGPQNLIEGVSQMHVDPDLRILGGGSAGCLAALAAREQSPTVVVTVLEKGGERNTRGEQRYF